MKPFLTLLAVVVALAGSVNFFVSFTTDPPVPLVLSHPPAMIAMAYLLFQHILPRLIYPTPAPPNEEAIAQLRGSGNEIAAGRCGGKIGPINIQSPFFHVRVFSDGILIQPLLLPAAPILREEIASLQEKNELLDSYIEIRHTSPRIKSPILLSLSPDSEMGKALLQLSKRSVTRAA